ncbi:MAG: glycosyltransferase [Coprobacillus sp.]
MENSVLISVIMSTYNEPLEQIRMSIDSILKQTHNNLQFIIVIDNPLNHGLVSLLEQYEGGDSRIKLLKNDKNMGLTKSLNRMLTHVDGDYVARMDADDVAVNTRLEMQLEFTLSHDCDMIGSNIVKISSAGEEIVKFIFPEFIEESTIFHGNPIAHPTWFLKREVFDLLGGYRDMPLCEDYDFLLRAFSAGFKIRNIQEYLLFYRLSPSGISQSNLLKQRLSSLYLVENYARINEVTKEELLQYLSNCNINQSKEKRYLKSSILYGKSSKYKQENKNINRYVYLIACCLMSYNYFKLNILSEFKKS